MPPEQRAEGREQRFFQCASLLFALCSLLCARVELPVTPAKPSILLVTLDTTRFDAIGPGTPVFNALASRGRFYRSAYCTVPQTLASHSSMLTGLYPAGHGVHENGRYLADSTPVLAQQLKAAGYQTAAFVSAFALAKRFGLARGFDIYDDDFGTAVERTANVTTNRAIAYLAMQHSSPTFTWVHYYDPHSPYTPPEPFGSKYAKQPYLGEVAFMDQQLGRLVEAFDKVRGPKAIVIVADHGEGLGDHGEAEHGNLLYQSTMRVPLLLIGPGVNAGTSDTPVSTRRVYSTILDWAGLDATHSFRGNDREVAIGEAMQPFLFYGWQPQVMAVDGSLKTILAGRTEVYDVVADPNETHDIAATANISREVRAALRDYPIPSLDAQAPATQSEEERRKLASLGYVSSGAQPVIRPDAPRPADMTALFPLLDESAALFAREQYAKAIPVLQHVLAKDPQNLDSTLRLATSYSMLGRAGAADAAFKRAEGLAPNSLDVATYLGLHYLRTSDWQKAVPLLERVVAQAPGRVPALEGLVAAREREGRLDDAVQLRLKIYELRPATPRELSNLGEMQMALGKTDEAIRSFERAGPGHDLQLGVLYLAARRFEEAKSALDRVPAASPDSAMALFKRAQVSVLLHEPDAASRIQAARAHADATTRPLIEREKLFR